MRKGNKSKALIVLLGLCMALNAFALAGAADSEETVLIGEEITAEPETEEIPLVDEGTSEELVIEDVEDADAEPAGEAELLAADEEGVAIQPGAIFSYNDKLYKVTGTTNVVSGGGGFNANVSIQKNDSDSTRTDNFICTGGDAAWNADAGHDAPGELTITNGTLIWRHKFNAEKLYVYSMWYKYEGSIKITSGQRQLAGATDVATGSQHYNEIGHAIPATGGWQQDMCVFRPVNGEDKFLYAQMEGSGTAHIDDFYIYEVEEYNDSLTIGSHQLERQSNMQLIDVPQNKLPAAGEYYHVINYSNANIVEYPVTGVVALMKDGKLERLFCTSTRTVRGRLENNTIIAANGSVDIWFEVPELAEGEDISQYSYIAYITTEGKPFEILGEPSDENAVFVNKAADEQQ